MSHVVQFLGEFLNNNEKYMWVSNENMVSNEFGIRVVISYECRMKTESLGSRLGFILCAIMGFSCWSWSRDDDN